MESRDQDGAFSSARGSSNGVADEGRKFIARSKAFREAMANVELFARTDEPIVLEGESGVGKSVLARRIHELSRRAGHPFNARYLSAIDDALASSQLCGHEKGSFTGALERRKGVFELSDRGTVFLDELGKASPTVQQRLIGVLDRGEFERVGGSTTIRVDVRVIVATNVPVEKLAKDDVLLDDLVPRLGEFYIRLPALRERQADIADLVEEAVRLFAPKLGYHEAMPRIDPDLMRALVAAPWEHNHRQLHSTVKRLLVEARGAETIGLWHCRDRLEYLIRVAGTTPAKVRKGYVSRALAERQKLTEIARECRVSRMTIHRDRQQRERDVTSNRSDPREVEV